MLRNSGSGVLVNNNPAPAAIALYRDDSIETSKEAVARIELTGSSADIGPGTMVEFEGDELVLDHGGLSVDTGRGLRVRVGCLTVVPVNDAIWTHFEVADVNGKVTVTAVKSDVYIDARSGSRKDINGTKNPERSTRSIVRETEQQTRDERCVPGAFDGQGTPPYTGPLLNSVWARAAGGGAIAVLTCWALCFHNSDPVSPSHP
jgi:hypothetical protein